MLKSDSRGQTVLLGQLQRGIYQGTPTQEDACLYKLCRNFSDGYDICRSQQLDMIVLFLWRNGNERREFI